MLCDRSLYAFYHIPPLRTPYLENHCPFLVIFIPTSCYCRLLTSLHRHSRSASYLRLHLMSCHRLTSSPIRRSNNPTSCHHPFSTIRNRYGSHRYHFPIPFNRNRHHLSRCRHLRHVAFCYYPSSLLIRVFSLMLLSTLACCGYESSFLSTFPPFYSSSSSFLRPSNPVSSSSSSPSNDSSSSLWTTSFSSSLFNPLLSYVLSLSNPFPSFASSSSNSFSSFASSSLNYASSSASSLPFPASLAPLSLFKLRLLSTLTFCNCKQRAGKPWSPSAAAFFVLTAAVVPCCIGE